MAINHLSLTGKIALITGASSGLGKQFALSMAEAGATVVLAARRMERLQALAADIENQGGRAMPVALDVTDKTNIEAVLDAVESQLGCVDVLVNNAGIGNAQPFLEMSESSWDEMMDTNLKSVWRLSQAVSRRLVRAEKPGSIVNIASILGLRGASQMCHYATAKAGVVHLTKVLALELARHQIRVNAIAPGYFLTEMNEDVLATEQGQAYVVQKVPMRRLGQTPELVGPMLLLASDAGAFMTGAVLPVDGGHVINSL